MPKQRGPPRPYVLLREAIPLDDETLDSLLGLAVEDLHKPLDWQYAPGIGPKGVKSKNLVENLYPSQMVEFLNGEAMVNRVHGQEAKAQLTQFLHVSAEHRDSSELTLKSSGFRRITMRNKRQRIVELLRNPAYKKPVVEILQQMDDRKMGVIVSVITCADMSIEARTEKQKEVGAGLEAPGEAIGVPGASIGVSGSYTNTRNVELKGRYKGEMLVACQYLQLQLLEPEPSFTLMGWIRKLRGGPQARIDVSSVEINPLTHDVGVTNKEIDGDLEELFGSGDGAKSEERNPERGVESFAGRMLKVQPTRRRDTDETDIETGVQDDEDDDNFILYL